jgi:hypothetical protein
MTKPAYGLYSPYPLLYMIYIDLPFDVDADFSMSVAGV